MASLLTVTQASKRSGVPVSTLCSAARRGTMRACRVETGRGRAVWAIRPGDLAVWLKGPHRRNRKQARTRDRTKPGRLAAVKPQAITPAPGPVIQPIRLVRASTGHREVVDLGERAARNLGLLKHQTGASTAEVLDAALVALVRELALHGVE